MIHVLGRLATNLNQLLDGPNGTLFRMLYVTTFFAAGAYAIYWFVNSLERAAKEHAAAFEARMEAYLKQSAEEKKEEDSVSDSAQDARKRRNTSQPDGTCSHD
mmetsp:Transcript_38817/g.60451  ORF Transcript_38817/g.60451 Transcript_38817/m.60451 type:complete len:103 (+) Transcript_38817:119-427(+)